MVLVRYAIRCYASDRSPCTPHPVQTWQIALLALVVLCQIAALAWFHPQRPLARLISAIRRNPAVHDLETGTHDDHAESGTCNCNDPSCRLAKLLHDSALAPHLDDNDWETDDEDENEDTPSLDNTLVATGTLRHAERNDNFPREKEYAVWIEKETESALWIEKVDDERYRQVLAVLEGQNAVQEGGNASWGTGEVTEEWDQPIVW